MLLARILQAVIAFCLIGIVLVSFQTGATSARQGVFVRDFVGFNSKTALNFDQPDIAKTFFGELKDFGRPALFSFKATKGQLFHAKVYIPNLEELADFRPALGLFGPGLPPPTSDQLFGLPFTVPPETGLVLSEQPINLNVSPDPLVNYNEPFTQSNYGEGQEILREIAQDGAYYLVVFSRIGQGGKYTLQVGDKPEAGLKETLGFPVLWSRTHLWFGDWVTPVLAWLGLGLIFLYGLYHLGIGLFARRVKVQSRPAPVATTSPALREEEV